MKPYSTTLTLLLLILAGSDGLFPLGANATEREPQKITTLENLRDQVQKFLDELNQNATLQSESIWFFYPNVNHNVSMVLKAFSATIEEQAERVREGLYLRLETKIRQEAVSAISLFFPKSLKGATLFNIERLPEKITAKEMKDPFSPEARRFGTFLNIRIRISISEKGDKILRAGAIFWALDNADVVNSVYAIGHALKNLDLLPFQRKVLNGFWLAAERFASALKVEEEKKTRGEKYKKDTHKDFMDFASLLNSYYRYLEEVFNESARLQSEARGFHETNVKMVEAVSKAIGNLVEAYGLDGDMTSRQAAVYSRVLMDLITNQLEPLSSDKEKYDLLRPIKLRLTEVLAKSGGANDIQATDEIKAFKDAWENRDFRAFMETRATSQDDRVSGLIMNVNSLAYKIGRMVRMNIDVIRAEDIEIAKQARAQADKNRR